jgi:hypothetical protein
MRFRSPGEIIYRPLSPIRHDYRIFLAEDDLAFGLAP